MVSYALTTVTRVKNFLGISVSTYDTLLDRLIDNATDYIERYCDRRFKETTYTQELYRGRNTPNLMLRNWPVDSASTFTLQRRDSGLNENNFSTIDSNLYFVEYDTGIVRLVGSPNLNFLQTDVFVKWPQYYRITYTAGYDYDNAATFLSTVGAADLEYAVWKLVGAMFNQRKVAGNVESESIGDYSVKYSTEAVIMDDEVKEILSRYRRLPG